MVVVEVDSVQYFVQADDNSDEQVFRLQVADVSDVFSIVTEPKPESLPISYDYTEITLPMCGPEADFEGDKQITWKVNNVRNLLKFVDFAGGSTLRDFVG
jgi:hypothetical protein